MFGQNCRALRQVRNFWKGCGCEWHMCTAHSNHRNSNCIWCSCCTTIKLCSQAGKSGIGVELLSFCPAKELLPHLSAPARMHPFLPVSSFPPFLLSSFFISSFPLVSSSLRLAVCFISSFLRFSFFLCFFVSSSLRLFVSSSSSCPPFLATFFLHFFVLLFLDFSCVFTAEHQYFFLSLLIFVRST